MDQQESHVAEEQEFVNQQIRQEQQQQDEEEKDYEVVDVI